MVNPDRIVERCPRFYKGWDEKSFLSAFIHAVTGELDYAEEGITKLMRAHWIDTAEGQELDGLGFLFGQRRISNEADSHFKTYLKKVVDEYRGGGTLAVITEKLQDLVKSTQVQIIENPATESYAEFNVVANDSWTLGSDSIQDEGFTLYMSVEDEGEVSNPRITNIDTGQSIAFQGTLKKEEQLIARKGSALIGKKDVTTKITFDESIKLPRKNSKWKYSEELLEHIGVFDSGKFDENTFAIGVPTVRIRFEWEKRKPATFMIHVSSKTLVNCAVTVSQIEKSANYLKAAGVEVIVKVTE
jgi:hypothetical protein